MANCFLYGNEKKNLGTELAVWVDPPADNIDGAALSVLINKDDITKTSSLDSNGRTSFKDLDSGDWTVTAMKGQNTRVTQTVTVQNEYEIRIGLFSYTVHVTYPIGSICQLGLQTGGTSYQAPDTSGSWTVIIPFADTWYFHISDGGDNSLNQAFEVSEDMNGQSTSLELSYALYLFKPNDSCESITGGWSIDSTGNEKLTYGEVMTVTSVNYYNNGRYEGIYTNNAIDLTKYNTLSATCYATNGSQQKLVVSSGGLHVASVDIGTSLSTVTLDISELSGSYNIGFYAYHSNYVTVTYTASEIKLIP